MIYYKQTTTLKTKKKTLKVNRKIILLKKTKI